jgi:hypothetical protein
MKPITRRSVSTGVPIMISLTHQGVGQAYHPNLALTQHSCYQPQTDPPWL